MQECQGVWTQGKEIRRTQVECTSNHSCQAGKGKDSHMRLALSTTVC